MGEVVDPLTQKPVIGEKYVDQLEREAELYGRHPESTFSYKDAPPRGRHPSSLVPPETCLPGAPCPRRWISFQHHRACQRCAAMPAR